METKFLRCADNAILAALATVLLTLIPGLGCHESFGAVIRTQTKFEVPVTILNPVSGFTALPNVSAYFTSSNSGRPALLPTFQQAPKIMPSQVPTFAAGIPAVLAPALVNISVAPAARQMDSNPENAPLTAQGILRAGVEKLSRSERDEARKVVIDDMYSPGSKESASAAETVSAAMSPEIFTPATQAREFGEHAPIDDSGARGILTHALMQPPPADAVLAQRLKEVIRHQNSLRAAKGLPALDAAVAPGFIPHSVDPRLRSVFVNQIDKSDFNTANQIFSVGNLMMKIGWGDVDSLNYVYIFDGKRLKQTMPFSEYVVKQVGAKEIFLVRNMGRQEYQLWQEKNIDELTNHGKTWGYEQKVLHFQLNGRSWVRSNEENVPVEWKIPRNIMLEWIRKGYLAMGVISLSSRVSDRLQIEVVIKEKAWKELAAFRSGIHAGEAIPPL